MEQTVNLIHDDELTEAELDRVAGGNSSNDPNGGGIDFPVVPPNADATVNVGGIRINL